MYRLISLAIQDKDKAVRESGKAEAVSDETIRSLIQTMIRQREKSSIAFEQHGQLDLAERERTEISVLKELLPPQLDEETVSKSGFESDSRVWRVQHPA